MPSFTFVATASAMRWLGLRPAFADVDPVTHTLDPASVRGGDHRRARAPSSASTSGAGPATVEALQEIADRHGVALFFDAAHGLRLLAPRRQGRRLRRGRGGQLPRHQGPEHLRGRRHPDRRRRAGRACPPHDAIRVRGRRPGRWTSGSTRSCRRPRGAMGLAQLERLDEVLAVNRAHHERYVAGLAGLPGLTLSRHPATAGPELPLRRARGRRARRPPGPRRPAEGPRSGERPGPALLLPGLPPHGAPRDRAADSRTAAAGDDGAPRARAPAAHRQRHDARRRRATSAASCGWRTSTARRCAPRSRPRADEARDAHGHPHDVQPRGVRGAGPRERPRAGDRRAVRRRGHRRRVDRRDARHRAPAARSPSRAGAPGLQRGQRELQPPVPRGVGALRERVRRPARRRRLLDRAHQARAAGGPAPRAPRVLDLLPRRRRRPRRPRPAELAQQRPAVGPAAGHRRPVGQEPHPRLLPRAPALGPAAAAPVVRRRPVGRLAAVPAVRRPRADRLPRRGHGRVPPARRRAVVAGERGAAAGADDGVPRGHGATDAASRRRHRRSPRRVAPRARPRAPSGPAALPRSCAGGSPPGRRRASCASDSTPSSRATRSPGRASSASSASPGAA